MKVFLFACGVFTLLFYSFTLQAQQKKIEGTVTNLQGEPLPATNVLVKGSNIGTTTDAQGYFEIKVAHDAILIFSSVGYQDKEVNVTDLNGQSVHVTLQQSILGLDELTVVGYSQVETKHVASSVATVDMAEIETQPISKLQEAFSGTIPGVVMMKENSMPGTVPGQIRIRGISTLQNADPLVIVDGMEQSLTDINPHEIKSITVLKDAASAAMYGSRGANGVIIIKTKRGSAENFNLELFSSVTVDDPIKLPDFVNSADFMKLRNEARTLQGELPAFTADEIALAENGKYVNVDWMDKIMQQRAYSYNMSANISGGGGVGTFSLMLGYKNERGLNPYQGQKMYSARFNTTMNMGDKFILLADFYARRLQVDRLHMGAGDDIYEAAWEMFPTDSIYYGTGPDRHYRLHHEINPVAMINEGGTAKNLYDRITLNLRPRYNLTEHLSLRGNISYMINKSASKYERQTFKFFDEEGKPTKTWSNDVDASQGTSVSQLTSRGLINYEKGLRNDKDKIYVTAGTEVMVHNYTDYREYSKASFFGKVNYSFDDRYILVGTIRADGSSKFAPGHRWGVFPAGAIAWNVHNEDFMSSLKESGFLNNLKFRLSYGIIGNENVDPYLWEEIVNNWGWTIRVPNPEFSWEKQKQANIGVDLTILDHRLSFTADVYRKHSYDLIFSSYPVPPLTGSHSLESAVNIGQVENKGWELSAKWSDQIGAISYSISGMLFNNQNKVLQAGYTSSDTLVFKGNSDKIWYKGIAMNNYYGFESNGYFQNENQIEKATAIMPNTRVGDIRYVDQNKDGIINNEDRVYLGNPDPHYNYAINIDLQYKNWTLDLMGQGVGKRLGRLKGLIGYPVIMDGSANEYGTPRQYYMDNRWTPETPHSRFPRVWTGTSPNAVLSDVWLSDASYFRIRSIQLGYELKDVTDSFKSIRFFINARDPFVFTDWEGLDPERNGGNGQYPRMRSFTFGVIASIY